MPVQTLEPIDLIDHAECIAPRSSERCQCETCGKVFAGGSVVDHKPMYDDIHGRMLMLRQLYCDHCQHVQNWTEAVDENGRRTGEIVSGPGRVFGRKQVAAFLHKHPQATGVMQR